MGITTIVDKQLKAERIYHTDYCLVVAINTDKGLIFHVNIYASPSNKPRKMAIMTVLEDLMNSDHQWILAGDLNTSLPLTDHYVNTHK